MLTVLQLCILTVFEPLPGLETALIYTKSCILISNSNEQTDKRLCEQCVYPVRSPTRLLWNPSSCATEIPASHWARTAQWHLEPALWRGSGRDQAFLGCPLCCQWSTRKKDLYPAANVAGRLLTVIRIPAVECWVKPKPAAPWTRQKASLATAVACQWIIDPQSGGYGQGAAQLLSQCLQKELCYRLKWRGIACDMLLEL